MNSNLKAVLIGLPFVAIYFLIRNLPVEPCDFLHEETYNAEGELDYCGDDDTGFVDLSVRKWPMDVEFRPIGTPKINENCKFEIKIEQADGSPLSGKDVALSHTKKIHLLVVNESLNDYHHVHPIADSLFDGIWHFSITPNLSGKYSVFLDFIPVKSPRRVLLSAEFDVQGEHSEIVKREETLNYSYNDINFSLVKEYVDSDPKEFTLTLHGSSKNDNNVVFYPVMGAFAHMVAFDENVRGFAHLHPFGENRPLSENETFSGPLSFGFSAPKDGIYRLWAQVKTNKSEEFFIPFDLSVGS